jgi:hypothetical protein
MVFSVYVSYVRYTFINTFINVVENRFKICLQKC